MSISVPVNVPLLGDERRKNWAKVVERVDETKASGWAYEGEFIATGGIQDVPVGAVVLVYGEKGSKANPAMEARVYLANSDGTLSEHATARGRAWARTLRDRVEELLDQDQLDTELSWSPELMRFSTDALEEELRRRS